MQDREAEQHFGSPHTVSQLMKILGTAHVERVDPAKKKPADATLHQALGRLIAGGKWNKQAEAIAKTISPAFLQTLRTKMVKQGAGKNESCGADGFEPDDGTPDPQYGDGSPEGDMAMDAPGVEEAGFSGPTSPTLTPKARKRRGVGGGGSSSPSTTKSKRWVGQKTLKPFKTAKSREMRRGTKAALKKGEEPPHDKKGTFAWDVASQGKPDGPELAEGCAKGYVPSGSRYEARDYDYNLVVRDWWQHMPPTDQKRVASRLELSQSDVRGWSPEDKARVVRYYRKTQESVVSSVPGTAPTLHEDKERLAQHISSVLNALGLKKTSVNLRPSNVKIGGEQAYEGNLVIGSKAVKFWVNQNGMVQSGKGMLAGKDLTAQIHKLVAGLRESTARRCNVLVERLGYK
jgi:hypothetical protein